MVFGGGAFGIASEWNWCPYKRDPQALPCPLGHVRTQREDAASEPGSRLSLDIESTGLLVLDFQPVEP